MSTSLICVDANLVIRLLVVASDSQVVTLWQGWRRSGAQLVAPALLHYELVNGIHQYRRRGELSAEGADQALAGALALPIVLQREIELHQRAFEMAAQYTLPAAYDAHYLATAERLGADFWTADRKLARAVQPHLDWVHLLADDE